jgi:hypothetical protein
VDQDAAKLIIGAIGVVLGASITAVATWLAARENRQAQALLAQQAQDTQRTLARDSARRARREIWASKFLNFLSTRYFILARLRAIADRGALQEFEELRNGALEDFTELQEVGWLAQIGFGRAKELRDYVTAERVYVITLVAMLKGTADQDDVDSAQKHLQDAIAAVYASAEEFIDAESPSSPAPRAVRPTDE